MCLQAERWVPYGLNGKPLFAPLLNSEHFLSFQLRHRPGKNTGGFGRGWRAGRSPVLAQRKARHADPCIMGKSPSNRLQECLEKLFALLLSYCI